MKTTDKPGIAFDNRKLEPENPEPENKSVFWLRITVTVGEFILDGLLWAVFGYLHLIRFIKSVFSDLKMLRSKPKRKSQKEDDNDIPCY